MKQLEAMQKQNQIEMEKQMREMGMNPADFNMGGYDDPELAELDREMRKRGKYNLMSLKYIYFRTEAGIMDEDDEAAMLAELDEELGIELVDPAIHQEQLR